MCNEDLHVHVIQVCLRTHDLSDQIMQCQNLTAGCTCIAQTAYGTTEFYTAGVVVPTENKWERGARL